MGLSKRFPLPPITTDGMYYMADTPADIAGGSPFQEIVSGADGRPYVVPRGGSSELLGDAELAAILGFSLSSLNPLNVARAVHNTAMRFSPHNLVSRAFHRGGGGGGGGPSAAAPAAAPGPDEAPPDAAATDDQPTDQSEGGLYGMLQSPTEQMAYNVLQGRLMENIKHGMQRLRGRATGLMARRRGHKPSWRHKSAIAGAGLADFARRGYRAAASPAGRLLISVVPGGATALEAHAIATEALRSGDLQPRHLQQAGSLTKRARGGDEAAIVQIANVRKRAGGGDAYAQKALDTLRLADCIQTGRRTGAGSAAPRGAAGAAYNHGRDALLSRYRG